MIEEEVIVVSRADPAREECLLLSEQSWTELNQLYGDIDRAEFFSLDFTATDSAFVLAHRNGQPVGCGAIRRFSPGVAEIKRVFVDPASRQHGVGQRVLAAL